MFEDDDNVGIWGKSGNFGDINAGDTVTTNYPYDFRISIPKSLKTPYDALFYLELSDKFGNVWRDSTIVSIE
ncbi:MAG: hypothetical protein GWP06_08820 [Actinobacteria bacterium]|nr:hypothetical protein [Actinomycetota bacterium]